MTAPKPDVDVFFEQKTVHLTNGARDPFRVLRPISNPILDIGGVSFLNGKDVWLAQLVLMVDNTLRRGALGRITVLTLQLLGLLVEGLQAWVIDFALNEPLVVSAVGRPGGGLAKWAG